MAALEAKLLGKNPDNLKKNQVNEKKLGYVTDPDIYWVGFHKEDLYKYIPVRKYNNNNKLINAPPKWVKMTDDEKSKYMEKMKKIR
jgi:hypoxanthine phosphoribosyltransferase